MINGDFTIRIAMLENGYTVEVPDYEKAQKLEAERAKKSKGGDYAPQVYLGACTEKMIAKTAKEVLDIVGKALAKLPPDTYAEAFEEATKEGRSGEPGKK